MTARSLISILPLLAAMAIPVGAVTPSASETAACRRWAEKYFSGVQPPYSFVYAGKANTVPTELQVHREVQRFDDFPAVEWLVRFENRGTSDSAILESVRALDARFNLGDTKRGTLHWERGAVASFDDFKPEMEVLEGGKAFHLDSVEGRSSGAVMPYFNLEGKGGGVIVAIGWSGTWAADFHWTEPGRVEVQAGMRNTHLKLHPGETIRTPRMLVLFYEGDRWRGQNLFRQFMLQHHRPQQNGKPLIAPVTCANWGGTSAAIHLNNIRAIQEKELPIAYYWIDAEWYGKPGPAGSWFKNVGDWAIRRDIFPDGFRPLRDALRKSGRELMLWFEPERVMKGTPWYAEHYNWLIDPGRPTTLLNLGNPEARRFVTDFISQRIDEYGLGCYRHDFGMNPMPYWAVADAADRQGIAEIRYIEGLYAFWDELMAKHPGLIIDNCAGGGRRLDFEAIGRATPFWRSDGPSDPIAHQAHTWGLLSWVPLNATSVNRAGDDYDFRSGMSSALALNWWVSGDQPAADIPPDFPFDWARRTLLQYLDFRKYFYGDYYPLTAYTQAADTWMAYELDRQDLGQGMVVVLKRPASTSEGARFKLRGLDPQAVYQVEWLDPGEHTIGRGAELMEAGIAVTLRRNPDSALIRYVKR
jgi:alpha-galactosidase